MCSALAHCEGEIMNQLELIDLMKHDAFRFGGGLYKSAARIYYALLHKSMTVGEIVIATGISRRTISRALGKMHTIVDYRTGEVIALVEQNSGVWYARKVDFDRVAFVIGTAGIGKRQRERHSYERKIHNRVFRPIRMNNLITRDEKGENDGN